MRNLLLTSLCLFLLNSTFAQSQAEMNRSALSDYKKADAELNTVYKSILKEYSGKATFIKNLKTSQKLWIQFRDAELNTKFPNPKSGDYGSVLPMCQSIYLTGLTQDRTKKLKEWLDGATEGDACNGSVKGK
jgi:uncharacterized protein YecT (DUF1311 family)